VWEWAEDCASLTYVGRPTDQRAWVWEGGCERRVQRGGGWITGPERSRSGFHGDGNVEDRADFAGFRVARDLP
jgi:formylglycine-generating enzyme required for sulfatase activity